MPIPDRLVVLTFDDGNKSDVTFVAPLLKRYGFSATFFITEGLEFLNDKRRCMTWEEVRSLHEAGFEIGNHTRSHGDPRKQSKEEFLAKVEHMERRLEENGIEAPRTFCYPGYFFNRSAVDVLAQKGYLFARRGLKPEFPAEDGCGRAYEPDEDHPLLIPSTFASGPNATVGDFLGAVKQARDGRIAVLTFHGVPDGYAWIHTEPAAFETYMRHLHRQRCTVIAMRDLARYVDPGVRPDDPFGPMERRLT